MYTDKRRKRWPLAVLVLALLIAAVGVWHQAVPASRQNLSEESAKALKNAVERCALQCYVVEGAYPPSLAYMEENYGLQINRREFYVVYDVFASNLPPDVRVVSRY